MTRRDSYGVVVVGGGPAGMAAAAAAAVGRTPVLLIDDNPGLGGQIWRGEEQHPLTRASTVLRETLAQRGVEVLRGARVFDAPQPGVLLAESAAGLHRVGYWQLILATGARERFLPFPGWTLPNVMGAGGLQALVKSGAPVEGKTVVVAGSGPLLLAVAAYLKQRGARIKAIVEQAPLSRLARMGAALLRHPAKLTQAVSLRRELAGVPYLTNCWPTACEGQGRMQRVTLQRGARRWSVECDYLACGFHLVPNTELPALLGCTLRDGYVAVNDMQLTSVADVYCAGEPTGIGGLELSLVEGRIAGHAAVGMQREAEQLFGERRKWRRFARVLEPAFALRPELREVAETTMLCRCEDVTVAQAREYGNWREAKLQARCGMGPCQGRVCGPAASFLFGWNIESVRPPVFPAELEHLAAEQTQPATV